MIDRRPQLVKLDAGRLRRMIDPDLPVMVQGWKEILGEKAKSPIRHESVTWNQHSREHFKKFMEKLEEIFGDGDEETVVTQLEKKLTTDWR